MRHKPPPLEAPSGEAAAPEENSQLPDFTPNQGGADEPWNDSDNEPESGPAPVIAIEEEEKSVGRGRGRKAKKTTVAASTTAAPAKDSTKPARKSKRAATAGANYCRLKIRTQGGYKGKNGGQRANGRFSRRR